MSKLKMIARLLGRSAVLAVAAFTITIGVIGSVAHAAADEPPPPATGTEVDSTLFHIPASTTTYIIAVLIPVVGGVAIRYLKSDNAKVAVGLVLNGLNALITTATTEGGDAILSASLVNNFIISTVVSIAALYGFYKQVKVGDQSIDAKLKGAA